MVNYKLLDPSQCDFIAVAPVNDLPNGERLIVDIDRQSIILFNIGGEYYAIEDVCSHDGNPLDDGNLHGYEVVCQRHGGSFDVRTGQVLSLPAIVDIPAYPTRVVDGMIEIGLPTE